MCKRYAMRWARYGRTVETIEWPTGENSAPARGPGVTRRDFGLDSAFSLAPRLPAATRVGIRCGQDHDGKRGHDRARFEAVSCQWRQRSAKTIEQ
jgi:hypothetical protein